MRFIKILSTAFILLSLTACGTSSEAPKVEKEQSAEELYKNATIAMQNEEYKKASRLFDEIERQHPYSELASKAQIMSALASYDDGRYDDSTITLDKFIQLHPGHEQIDYAYYLVALNYYDQITDVSRDQDMTLQAMRAFNTLINRFPNSKYRKDALIKRDLVNDHLAGKEMEIGRYYLNRGYVNASINRFKAVVDNYQTTTHVAEALHRLVECYMTLGIKSEAMRIASVLGHNYPGSKWYKRTYQLMDDDMRQKLLDDRSSWDRTIESIFKPE